MSKWFIINGITCGPKMATHMTASLEDAFRVLNFILPQQIESVTVSSKCGPKLWVAESVACGAHVSSRLYWKHEASSIPDAT